MKKLLLVLMGCSLALAAGAKAEDKPQPPKKQAAKARPLQQKAKPQPAMRQRNIGKAPNLNRKVAPQQPVHAARSVTKAPVIRNNGNAAVKAANVNRKQQVQDARAQTAIARKAGDPATNAKLRANGAAVQANQARKANAQAKKIDVQSIRNQRASFRAQARPQQVPAVSFNQNYRIRNANNWRGAKYAAFRAYRPARHDRGWYRSHYDRVELFGGGYYYWNSGYWYPAWGYDTSSQYYAYDGPIYAGSAEVSADRVIAEVQDALQQQGYYQGEVDGLLGPQTRDALTQYQADNGIYTTATIDEPTLESLGLS